MVVGFDVDFYCVGDFELGIFGEFFEGSICFIVCWICCCRGSLLWDIMLVLWVCEGVVEMFDNWNWELNYRKLMDGGRGVGVGDGVVLVVVVVEVVIVDLSMCN